MIGVFIKVQFLNLFKKKVLFLNFFFYLCTEFKRIFMKRTKSDAFVRALILMQTEQTYQGTASGSIYENGRYRKIESDLVVTKTSSEIVISSVGLSKMVSSSAWRIIGHIVAELKQYNALWECSPELKKSSGVKKAINELLHLEIIYKTETTNIYLVNPKFIRRGNYHAVLAATINMLKDVSKVNSSHVVNKKPVREIFVDNNPVLCV